MGILSLFTPDMRCRRITDIPLAELRHQGIKGLLFDLDNTITEWHKMEIPTETSHWLGDLARQGFVACIVSNNHQQRVQPLAQELGWPYVYDAAKPSRKSYRQAAALLNLAPADLAMVGDQLLTDILGGNRAGLYTIFVEYLHPREHWGTTHFFRPVERLLLRHIK